jgi:hypothetical protein
MALTQEGLLARAAQAEAAAASVTDPVISKAYQELAAAFRDVANLATETTTDEEVEKLAERMVSKTSSKL